MVFELKDKLSLECEHIVYSKQNVYFANNDPFLFTNFYLIEQPNITIVNNMYILS